MNMKIGIIVATKYCLLRMPTLRRERPKWVIYLTCFHSVESSLCPYLRLITRNAYICLYFRVCRPRHWLFVAPENSGGGRRISIFSGSF